ncbi:hypothetical protein EUGRSUZ_E00544 [Eucalyptus grandis]|uniref:Uncharacterized protein n=2 Tax=Eucalyptus grandis TaxID=71139 RepID=A0A059C1J7_EUCGR|nr:hypothetical protein EUGRSUZ_E00544 [Eucalyptus grandis]
MRCSHPHSAHRTTRRRVRLLSINKGALLNHKRKMFQPHWHGLISFCLFRAFFAVLVFKRLYACSFFRLIQTT